MERSHLLYLAMDNSLQDCAQMPGQDSELVEDYKKMSQKCPTNKGKDLELYASHMCRWQSN